MDRRSFLRAGGWGLVGPGLSRIGARDRVGWGCSEWHREWQEEAKRYELVAELGPAAHVWVSIRRTPGKPPRYTMQITTWDGDAFDEAVGAPVTREVAGIPVHLDVLVFVHGCVAYEILAAQPSIAWRGDSAECETLDLAIESRRPARCRAWARAEGRRVVLLVLEPDDPREELGPVSS